MTALRFLIWFTTSQNRTVGPVSLLKAMVPSLSSTMKPVVGTMWVTEMALKVRPLIVKACSGVISINRSTGVRSLGSCVKSGQVVLLNKWFFIDAMTSFTA